MQSPEILLDNIVGPCQSKTASKRCLACILDTSDYFLGLSLDAKQALQEILQLRHIGRRTQLYREQEPSDALYILVNGEVKIYKSLPNGRQQIHKLAQIPGDLIACEDLFLDTYNSSAESLTPISVCAVRKQDLFQLVANHREVSDTLMHSMARNLNAYIRHIANLGQKTALERVASYLVFLKQTHQERNLRSSELSESLTRTELADMIGVTQRTLIRSLRQLEDEETISLTKAGFIILNDSALEYLSAGH